MKDTQRRRRSRHRCKNCGLDLSQQRDSTPVSLWPSYLQRGYCCSLCRSDVDATKSWRRKPTIQGSTVLRIDYDPIAAKAFSCGLTFCLSGRAYKMTPGIQL